MSIALYQGGFIKSTLQTIIQQAYFQHLNTLKISPYRRSSPPIMMNESEDKETHAKAQLVPGPTATAGPVCAGEEGDYICGFIFYIYSITYIVVNSEQ